MAEPASQPVNTLATPTLGDTNEDWNGVVARGETEHYLNEVHKALKSKRGLKVLDWIENGFASQILAAYEATYKTKPAQVYKEARALRHATDPTGTSESSGKRSESRSKPPSTSHERKGNSRDTSRSSRPSKSPLSESERPVKKAFASRYVKLAHLPVTTLDELSDEHPRRTEHMPKAAKALATLLADSDFERQTKDLLRPYYAHVGMGRYEEQDHRELRAAVKKQIEKQFADDPLKRSRLHKAVGESTTMKAKAKPPTESKQHSESPRLEIKHPSESEPLLESNQPRSDD